MKETNIDADFWSHFSKEFWEQKPLLVKKPKSPIFELNEEHIFTLLVRYSDRCRKLKTVDGLKFFVEGQRQYDEEILQILPVKKDKSLLGYHRRMEKIFSDYCLVCDELLQVSHEKWDVLSNFMLGLYEQIGFPNQFAEMGLYLGNYRKTPFGVHVDGCGVFSFPVLGTKKFRLWTPDFVKKNLRLIEAHKYSRYKKNSKLLVAHPGDMVYWPSSAWHVAESDGTFSATWSLGVWLDRPHRDNISAALKILLDRKLGDLAASKTIPFQKLHQKDGSIHELPELYSQSISILQKLTKAELQDTLIRSWMILTSKQGFKTALRKDITSKLLLRDCIQERLGQSPILWAQLKSESKNGYAFNGVLVESSDSQNLFNLIKALNAGEPCMISQFLAGSNKSQDLKCLQALFDSGAFSIKA